MELGSRDDRCHNNSADSEASMLAVTGRALRSVRSSRARSSAVDMLRNPLTASQCQLTYHAAKDGRIDGIYLDPLEVAPGPLDGPPGSIGTGDIEARAWSTKTSHLLPPMACLRPGGEALGIYIDPDF